VTTDPDDADTTRLSAQSYARNDPTGWFEQLYAESSRGAAIVPWDRGTPSAQLVQWGAARDGSGLSAVVVGCGLGRDSEYLASLGYRTIAFDVSATAVRVAQERHPQSSVRYEVADLLDLPAQYRAAFDLVVESYTVQSLPDPPRGAAIAAVTTLVAPGGTLLVVAAARDDGEGADGPPWPLTRAEVDAFAVGDVHVSAVERLVDDAGTARWRAQFVRG
jgi:SAM-dependent methyltransferase